jgi:hypothetical protein
MSIGHTLWARRPIEINTDPQRRCYNGCHFSSIKGWAPWEDLYSLPTVEEAQESIASWRKLNPSHEYVALPEGKHPCP